MTSTVTTGLFRAFLLALLIAGPTAAHAQDAHAPAAEDAHGPAAEEEGEKLDAVHHTSDGAYLDIEPFGDGAFELPRIFLVRRPDGALGFDGFGSSTAAVASGRYAAEAEHGAETEGEALPAESAEGEGDSLTPDALAADSDEAEHAAAGGHAEDAEHGAESAGGHGSAYEAHLVPTDGSTVVADFSMTRHLVFIFLGIALLALLLLPMASKYKRGVGRTSAPRGRMQNLLETLVIYVRDEIARPNLGEKTDRYLPYLLTVFFFILICNLLGLVPWGATATSNITVTAVLAVFTFIVTQMAGTKDYWRHILWPPGIPWYVNLILVPIEILGLFTKPFALAVRLFANMVAGHLVILNLIGLIFIIGGSFGVAAGYGTAIPALLLTVGIYGLELLVVFIQAYVFTVLSALFIGMASAEHEHDHDHSEDHGPTAHDIAVSQSNGQKVHVLPERTVGTEAAMMP
ncbi:MAG TPA: F0F1 ATP synthase subunit A [Rubricoccaceae bacterium]|jgi:F-type H+-transporting ATPase subunit a